MTSLALDRRTFLAGGTAALGLAATARAEAPMLGLSRPTVYRFKVGAFEVTTILDGAVQVPGPHPIFGENATEEDVAALAGENFLPADQMEIPFTVTLVNTGAELVAFDSGNGDIGRRPAAGLLRTRLAAAGYTPEQVDVVALTHFHPDHIGGLTEEGSAAFPNARYAIPAQEYDFWTHEDRMFENGMPERLELINAKVVPFAEQATMIAPGDAVVSGVEAVKSWGHTPGHTCYHLESEGERLLVLGDVCNHYVMSLQRPDWHVLFDMDKEMAVAARRETLGMIAADKIPFIGYHMPPPAVGYLETMGRGFRFVPASYQLNL